MTCPICGSDACKSVKHMVQARKGPKPDRSAEKARARHRKYSATEKGRETRKVVQGRRRSREAKTLVLITPDEWQTTLQHFGGKCAYCDSTGRLERDHFVPVTLGGAFTKNNTVPACRSCNAGKREIDPLEWMMGKNKLARYVEIFNYLGT